MGGGGVGRLGKDLVSANCLLFSCKAVGDIRNAADRWLRPTVGRPAQ